MIPHVRVRTPSRCPLLLLCVIFALPTAVFAQVPSNTQATLRPPTDLQIGDRPFDGGAVINASFKLSPDDARTNPATAAGNPVKGYQILRCGEPLGLYEPMKLVIPTSRDYRVGYMTVPVEKCIPGERYWFQVVAMGDGDIHSAQLGDGSDRASGVASLSIFDGGRLWMGVISAIVCLSVALFVLLAQLGYPLKVRPIAGLEAIEEAVGRATEMGRPCLFVPGILDMNDMQTIAGLTILSRVSQRNAEYDTPLEVPTSRSLVMTAARETVEASYLVAGRPDAYNQDQIYYVSDEQFAYAAYLTGYMVREKPAACFYFGTFYAESLILSETGNSIGAIQVAGTAEPSQLPFFVAACDYTLIGEEFFAASAYLSKDPNQLGSLKGQDVGKLIVVSLILIGTLLVTLQQLDPANLGLEAAATFVRDRLLSSG